MKVVSTNIGELKKINWKGNDVVTGIYKTPVEYPIFLSMHGVKKDNVKDTKHHGGIDKACYLYSTSHYKLWQEKYPKLEFTYGMFGENLSISEMDEAYLYIGDEYQIGEAIIQISQPRIPCYKLGMRFNSDKVVKEFIDENLPGAYVRILKEGYVKTGDELILLKSPDNKISLKDANSLIYSNDVSLENTYKQLNKNKYIAASCLKEIKRKWE